MYSESIASAQNRGHRVGLLDIHLLQSFIIKQFVKKFGFFLSCPTLYEDGTTCTRRIFGLRSDHEYPSFQYGM